MQKQRSVFFNLNHCLLIVFTFANNAVLKFKRMYIYECTYIHRYICPSSSTAADSSQHASPQHQVRHILGYIWVSHPRRKTNRVRARDSDIDTRDSPLCRLLHQPTYNCLLQNWRKRFQYISLVRVWRFKCKYKKTSSRAIMRIYFYIREKRWRIIKISIYRY